MRGKSPFSAKDANGFPPSLRRIGGCCSVFLFHGDGLAPDFHRASLLKRLPALPLGGRAFIILFFGRDVKAKAKKAEKDMKKFQ